MNTRLVACLMMSACFLAAQRPVLSQTEDLPSAKLLQQLEDGDQRQRRDAAYELVRREDFSESVLRGLAAVANDRD